MHLRSCPTVLLGRMMTERIQQSEMDNLYGERGLSVTRSHRIILCHSFSLLHLRRTHHVVHGFKLYTTSRSSRSHRSRDQSLIYLFFDPEGVGTVAHDPERVSMVSIFIIMAYQLSRYQDNDKRFQDKDKGQANPNANLGPGPYTSHQTEDREQRDRERSTHQK